MIPRRTITQIVAWWRHRRVLRATPALIEISRQIATAKRKHRPTANLQRAMRDIVHDRLRKEFNR